MFALLGGLVAETIVGYVEGEVMAKVKDAGLEMVGNRMLSAYILEESAAAANNVVLCSETRAIFDKNNERFRNFKKIRKSFAYSIIKNWSAKVDVEFVTQPPCGEGTLEAVADDLKNLIKAIRSRLWGDERFKELMGNERYQDVIQFEVQALMEDLKDTKAKLEEVGIQVKCIQAAMDRLSGGTGSDLVESSVSVTSSFVGREDKIREIDEAFESTNIVFVNGFGGIGKSELCREYASRQRRDTGAKIAWLDFSGTIRGTIASGLRFRSIDESSYKDEDELFEAKVKALSGEDGVLLVIDNCGWDGDVSDLRDLGCKVLVTTRSTDIPYRTVTVGELPMGEAFDLLRRSVDGQLRGWVDANRRGLEEALDSVGRLTVMIPMMAGLINEVRPEPGALAAGLFGFTEEVDLTKDGRTRGADTKGHFRRLMEGFDLSEMEWDALEVMSILPAEGMERKALADLSGIDYGVVSELSKKGILAKRYRDDGIDIQMHPLVADFIRAERRPSFADGEPCRRFLDSFSGLIEAVSDSPRPADLLPYAGAMASVASFLDGSGSPDAEFYACRLFSVSLFELGLYGESMEIALRCMDIAKNHCQYGLPDALNMVGNGYLMRGDYDRALTCMLEALKILESALPEGHPTIAESLSSVGNVYDMKGDHEEALKYHLRALAIFKKDPENRKNIALSMNSIGINYGALGEHEKAIDYGLEGLGILMDVYNESHPEIANMLMNVAGEYEALGDYSKASEFDKMAISMMEEVLPEGHPNIVMAMGNIGVTYEKLGDHEKALEYSLKALDKSMGCIPEGNPFISSTMDTIGVIYGNLGDHEKALKYLYGALENRRKNLPANHPDIASSMCNLGAEYADAGDHKKASECFTNALSIMEGSLPANHPDIASVLNNIGISYSKSGDHEKALHHFLRAQFILEEKLPAGHSLLITNYSNIGTEYKKLGDHENAVKYMTKALEESNGSMPGGVLQAAKLYLSVGNEYRNLGDYDKALKSDTMALTIFEMAYPDGDLAVAESLNNIGVDCLFLKDYGEALEYMRRSLAVYKKVLPRGHPDIVSLEDNIREVKRMMKDDAKASDGVDKDISTPSSGEPERQRKSFWSRRRR